MKIKLEHMYLLHVSHKSFGFAVQNKNGIERNDEKNIWTGIKTIILFDNPNVNSFPHCTKIF